MESLPKIRIYWFSDVDMLFSNWREMGSVYISNLKGLLW